MARRRPGSRFATTAPLEARRAACFGTSENSNTGDKQTSGLAPGAARLTMFTEMRQLMHTLNLPI
jgi:hypothetical protein